MLIKKNKKVKKVDVKKVNKKTIIKTVKKKIYIYI